MKENLIQSAKRPPDREDSRPPLAPVHQALYQADALAELVHDFLDTLLGAEPQSASETSGYEPAGLIPALLQHSDRVRERISRASDRLSIAQKELSQ
nr:hypothetical protein [Brucella anthropi]